MCASREYDDNLYIRVATTTLPYKVYSERSIPIDQAYDVVEKHYGQGSSISKVTLTLNFTIVVIVVIVVIVMASIF